MKISYKKTSSVSASDAAKILNSIYPNSKIVESYDLNSNKYLFGVKANKNDAGQYYAVDKKTGMVGQYSPVVDFDEFQDAINRKIQI